MGRIAISPGSSEPPARRASTAGRPPPFRPLQLATLVDTVPGGDRWMHEMKYDG